MPAPRCFICFVLGLASKENTATLPIALLLLEFIFFQDLGQKQTRLIFLVTFIFALVVFLVLGVVVFFKGNPLQVLNYDIRYFSPLERLLTESRVLVFYLSQIFYPAPNRLSIEHDIILSTSIVSPWTTSASIIIILGLLSLAVILIKKRPVLSFAILFFFLNHIIESSIIGLELIFEHRNYLASMFIFFPVAFGADWLLGYYRDKNLWMYRVWIGFFILILIGFGISTYVRNTMWTSGYRILKRAVGL